MTLENRKAWVTMLDEYDAAKADAAERAADAEQADAMRAVFANLLAEVDARIKATQLRAYDFHSRGLYDDYIHHFGMLREAESIRRLIVKHTATAGVELGA